MVQILVPQSALQGLYHRPRVPKGTDREGAAQAKMTAETTSILLAKHVSVVCLTS